VGGTKAGHVRVSGRAPPLCEYCTQFCNSVLNISKYSDVYVNFVLILLCTGGSSPGRGNTHAREGLGVENDDQKSTQDFSVAYTGAEKPRLCARFRETNPMKVMKHLQRSETLKTPSLGCFLLCGSWLGGYRISGTSGTVGGVSGTGYVKQNPWQFWGGAKKISVRNVFGTGGRQPRRRGRGIKRVFPRLGYEMRTLQDPVASS